MLFSHVFSQVPRFGRHFRKHCSAMRFVFFACALKSLNFLGGPTEANGYLGQRLPKNFRLNKHTNRAQTPNMNPKEMHFIQPHCLARASLPPFDTLHMEGPGTTLTLGPSRAELGRSIGARPFGFPHLKVDPERFAEYMGLKKTGWLGAFSWLELAQKKRKSPI